MKVHSVFLAALIGHAASITDKCQFKCVHVPLEWKNNCVFTDNCWMQLSKCELDILNCYTASALNGRTEKVESCNGKTNFCPRFSTPKKIG